MFHVKLDVFHPIKTRFCETFFRKQIFYKFSCFLKIPHKKRDFAFRFLKFYAFFLLLVFLTPIFSRNSVKHFCFLCLSVLKIPHKMRDFCCKKAKIYHKKRLDVKLFHRAVKNYKFKMFIFLNPFYAATPNFEAIQVIAIAKTLLLAKNDVIEELSTACFTSEIMPSLEGIIEMKNNTT